MSDTRIRTERMAEPMRPSPVRTLSFTALAACALVAGTGHALRAQTIPETAAEIEKLVDFTGPVIVDGDTVQSVAWSATDAPCIFDLVMTGTSADGVTSSEFGWTLDFAHVFELVQAETYATGVAVSLRAKGEDFPIWAKVTATTSESVILEDFKQMLEAGEADGTCTETSCDLTRTAPGAQVMILNDITDTDLKAIKRPFGLLALLCQSNPDQ